MSSNRVQSQWQRAAEAQNVSTETAYSSVDLAKPDAAAAELADTLQKITANTLFTRVVLMSTKWVIRPLIWLPIKYTCKLAWLHLQNSRKFDAEREETTRRHRESDRRYYGN